MSVTYRGSIEIVACCAPLTDACLVWVYNYILVVSLTYIILYAPCTYRLIKEIYAIKPYVEGLEGTGRNLKVSIQNACVVRMYMYVYN